LWKTQSELNAIKLNFSGKKNSTVEIDSIREGSLVRDQP